MVDPFRTADMPSSYPEGQSKPPSRELRFCGGHRPGHWRVDGREVAGRAPPVLLEFDSRRGGVHLACRNCCQNRCQQPGESGEAAPEGRPPYLVEDGAPKGIRTPDLRLERA